MCHWGLGLSPCGPVILQLGHLMAWQLGYKDSSLAEYHFQQTSRDELVTDLPTFQERGHRPQLSVAEVSPNGRPAFTCHGRSAVGLRDWRF